MPPTRVTSRTALTPRSPRVHECLIRRIMSTTPEAACATGSLGWDQDLRWTGSVRRWTWGNADPRPLSVTTTHEKARPPAREGSARRRPRSQDGGGEDEARFARGVLLPVAQDLARDLVDAARAA